MPSRIRILPPLSAHEICNAENPDGANTQGYCNPALDELFNKQAVTVDPVARKELFTQIQQIMYDDVVYIGMWQDPDLWSLSNRLQNVNFWVFIHSGMPTSGK